jgi:peptidoglycan/LPS O-acetylase OafA/YrhL
VSGATTLVAEPASPEPVPKRANGKRLAWLDALRGIAALFVVFDHLSPHVLEHAHYYVYQAIDPGLYGVCVFFLVSGYIVPASLERTGSVRRFWVSRMFRLYPLFLVAIATLFVLNWMGLAGFRNADKTPITSVLGHLLMMNDLLGVPNVINVLWTLSYEMVFYLLLTALFVLGVHRRSERYALGFATVALLLGGILPTVWLSHSALGARKVALLADFLIIVGVALALTSRRVPRVAGALVAASTAMALLTFNGEVPPYEGFTILALMFTGTMLYRAERGDFSMRWAIAIAVTVFAVVIAAGAWHLQAGQGTALARREWIISLVLAGATFAAGMAMRHLKIPLVLAWLGLVSYSVYLLHQLVVDVYTQISWTRGHRHPFGEQLLLAAGFLVVLLACCAVTYYLVEAPMQRLGRSVARIFTARPGSVRPGSPRPDPVQPESVHAEYAAAETHHYAERERGDPAHHSPFSPAEEPAENLRRP